MTRLIYVGDSIRTTDKFDPFVRHDGRICYWLSDGAIAVTLYDVGSWGNDRFAVTLDCDEWELTDEPGLYEVSGERGFFDD
jgi:hypothetical protein